MRRTRYPMPVEPFREILVKAMHEREVQGLDAEDTVGYIHEGVMTPLEQVTEQLADKLHIQYGSAARNVYRILTGHDKSRGKVYEVKQISLDWADAIACCFAGGALFWVTDERVSTLYEEIAA